MQRFCDSDEAEFVVIYSRRSVGKTHLDRRFFDERFAFYAMGVADGHARYDTFKHRYGRFLLVPLAGVGG